MISFDTNQLIAWQLRAQATVAVIFNGMYWMYFLGQTIKSTGLVPFNYLVKEIMFFWQFYQVSVWDSIPPDQTPSITQVPLYSSETSELNI